MLVGTRRETKEALEVIGEVALVEETNLERHVSDWHALCEQGFRPLKANLDLVGVGGIPNAWRNERLR